MIDYTTSLSMRAATGVAWLGGQPGGQAGRLKASGCFGMRRTCWNEATVASTSALESARGASNGRLFRCLYCSCPNFVRSRSKSGFRACRAMKNAKIKQSIIWSTPWSYIVDYGNVIAKIRWNEPKRIHRRPCPFVFPDVRTGLLSAAFVDIPPCLV